ncbi:hypothetical protein [Synechococcus sp. CBW1006]|uniref:hypothetical protein n=1 Tax=Synechococcus sp. CBW1006 TaxID=1353138 RepID=UPI0018CEDD99|nr:hypothetical protein [Synechococcus sp. CBW1006]QPN65720.1 hypothetical protein H8F26_12480 [Synechococcus sp. CBW1006]
MSALSPEQALVLTAIDRFLADPELAFGGVDTDDDSEGDGTDDPDSAVGIEAVDVLEVISKALLMVLPAEEIEQAITNLLACHGDQIDDSTQVVLEALLQTIERDDTEVSLEALLTAESDLLQTNALDSAALLVWDEQTTPMLEELEILDLLEAYPCRGPGARWTPDIFVQLLEAKGRLFRQTLLAVEILEEQPDTRPNAHTMLVMVPPDPKAPLELMELVVPLTVLSSPDAPGQAG